MFILNKQDCSFLYSQLYEQIRASILNGEMQPGFKLPSIRSVSIDLNISKTTVETAYSKLYLDGFLTTKPKSGYYVNNTSPSPLSLVQDTPFFDENLSPEVAYSQNGSQNCLYDFCIQNHAFDDNLFSDWQKLINRCLREYKQELISYQRNAGDLGLRQEILKYLKSYRNMNCTLEQIIITAGIHDCYSLISEFLTSRKYRLAFENPGRKGTYDSLEQHGVKLQFVGLDADGLNVQELRSTPARAVMVTPSPQFPTGIVMPLSRRLELIEWAKATKSLIIENNRDFYIKYHANPLPALQSLSPERVIYINTFSKVIFPSIRIAFMVLPQDLITHFNKFCPVPFIMQKTLELFMKEGYWDRHLRKTMRKQRQKQRMLLESLQKEFGNTISISGINTNSSLIISPTWSITEDELVARADKVGVKVNPLSASSTSTIGTNGSVLLSYGGINPEEIPNGIKLLRQSWIDA